MRQRYLWAVVAGAAWAVACGGGADEAGDGAEAADETAATERPAAPAPEWSSAEEAMERQIALWNELADVLAEVHDEAGASAATSSMGPISDEIDAAGDYLAEHPLGMEATRDWSSRLLDAQARYAGEMSRIAASSPGSLQVLAPALPGR